MPSHISSKKKGEVAVLPMELQLIVDATIAWLTEVQKEGYHNELKPFSHVAEQTKARGQEYFTDLYNQLIRAHNILRETFEKQEKVEKQSFPEEASFAVWQDRDSRMFLRM